MPHLDDEINCLEEHIQTLHEFLEVMNPILDIKNKVADTSESERPRVLRIEVENCDGSRRKVELNPDALDTYLVFKQTCELTRTRVEQLERNLKKKEQQRFNSML